jgi:hypothetical protein
MAKVGGSYISHIKIICYFRQFHGVNTVGVNKVNDIFDNHNINLISLMRFLNIVIYTLIYIKLYHWLRAFPEEQRYFRTLEMTQRTVRIKVPQGELISRIRNLIPQSRFGKIQR